MQNNKNATNNQQVKGNQRKENKTKVS